MRSVLFLFLALVVSALNAQDTLWYFNASKAVSLAVEMQEKGTLYQVFDDNGAESFVYLVEEGQVIEELSFHPSGAVSHLHFSFGGQHAHHVAFDHFGRIVSQEVLVAGQPSSRINYHYDEQGRQYESISCFAPMMRD